MNRQKKKRNHWVPQSYLRAFAADDKREKIWRFGKSGGEPELKPIEKVAVKFYLYTPGGSRGRDYSFEDKLASIERLFGPPYWPLVTGGFPDLCSEPIRKGLSLLTAIMFLRNPRHLDVMREIHASFVDYFSQLPEIPDAMEINGRRILLDAASWPEYRGATEDDIKRMWLDQVGSAVWLAEILMKMRWAMKVSETPVFITTDNPVVALHKTLRFRGFKDPDTTIVFPLSPRRVLCFDNRLSEPDGQYYPARDGAPSLNGLLWRESIEHMFSPRHPDEICAEIVQDAERMGFA